MPAYEKLQFTKGLHSLANNPVFYQQKLGLGIYIPNLVLNKSGILHD
jgi:hypothetical protein